MPASIRRGAPGDELKLLLTAGSYSEASRDAAQPQAADGKKTARAATLSKQEERAAGVEARRHARRRAKAVSDSWLVQRGDGKKTARAATLFKQEECDVGVDTKRRARDEPELIPTAGFELIAGAARDAAQPPSSGGDTTTHRTASCPQIRSG